MATRYCPSCGGEFVGTLDVCPDCEEPLVDEPPASAPSEDPPVGEVAYDLADWSIEGRKLVDQLLAGQLGNAGEPGSIPHAWEGSTLVVPAMFEGRVDVLIDQAAASVDGVDLGEEQVAYDLDDLTDAQYSALYEALEELAVPFALDEEGALVVGSGDQAKVEEALDRVEAAAATIGGYANASHLLDGASGEDDESADDVGEVQFGDEEIDGDVLLGNLGEVFVAADRLTHHPTDAGAVLSYADGMAVLRRSTVPFGYEASTWARILVTAGALLDALESEDVVPDERIVELARAVADLLRPLV